MLRWLLNGQLDADWYPCRCFSAAEKSFANPELPGPGWSSFVSC